MKVGLVALLCEAHPDKFPHSLASDVVTWSREAQHAEGTRQQARANAHMIAIHLVGQDIEYAQFRRDPDRYRPSIERALAGFTSAGDLQTALDLIEMHRLPQSAMLPLQPSVLSTQAPTTQAASSSSSSPAAPTSAAKPDFALIYYRKTSGASWSGAWTQATAGKVDKTAFSQAEADDAEDSEQGLSVKALHLRKQIGGHHWSLVAECSPDSLMIKMDLVQKGYRVYVGAKFESGYETETFNVQSHESLTVKDVYATMARVAGEIGGWQDNEQRNCRGFTNSMIAGLKPMLSDSTTPAGRQRKPPERFDPAKG